MIDQLCLVRLFEFIILIKEIVVSILQLPSLLFLVLLELKLRLQLFFSFRQSQCWDFEIHLLILDLGFRGYSSQVRIMDCLGFLEFTVDLTELRLKLGSLHFFLLLPCLLLLLKSVIVLFFSQLQLLSLHLINLNLPLYCQSHCFILFLNFFLD